MAPELILMYEYFMVRHTHFCSRKERKQRVDKVTTLYRGIYLYCDTKSRRGVMPTRITTLRYRN
jgi:hypothetical protein